MPVFAESSAARKVGTYKWAPCGWTTGHAGAWRTLFATHCSLAVAGAGSAPLASCAFRACVHASAAPRVCAVILWMLCCRIFAAKIQTSSLGNQLSYLCWALPEVILERPSWATPRPRPWCHSSHGIRNHIVSLGSSNNYDPLLLFAPSFFASLGHQNLIAIIVRSV